MTGAFTKIESTIEGNYGQSLEASVGNYGGLIEGINRIDDNQLQLNILNTVIEVIKTGFSNMFITTAILSLLVIICGIYLLNRKSGGIWN